MHFEVLTEDQSGGIAVDILLKRILGENRKEHSWKIIPYKGLGRIPPAMRGTVDPNKRILLDRLPTILQGYGRSLGGESAVVVVVDLDRRDCLEFKRELVAIWNSCNPRPVTLFRIAIEETEAWLLGDREAIMAAYPRAKTSVLDKYEQDSICGTWEVLADAVQRGGAKYLIKRRYRETGAAKCEWARKITPHMVLERNRSPSFRAFVDGVARLATE